MSINLANAKQIFRGALRIEAKPQRATFLDRACAHDVGLRQQVQALLDAHHNGASLFDDGLFDAECTIDSCQADLTGERIGAYKLRELLGTGGMGSVYVAEQEHPIRRKVALKLIKAGMDSHQVTARFEIERQTLALMDHPHIAKVFDGGTTNQGRPYFVMELVRGLPLTEFCDARKLSTNARLVLFIKVCQAVQHAHQKGIIHRDIKPSNVLVTLHDDVAVPKVIDFGIAKVTDTQAAGHSVYTAFAQLIGTPLYMSPEQAQLNSLDVDTRSDVYSLGVLLYETITGSTPFDAKELERAGFDEMRRIIREIDPPKPSQRLLASEKPGHTLQATELVHEAYLRLVGVNNSPHWEGRGHFFGAAAEAMRRILIDVARRKAATMNGGGLERVELEEIAVTSHISSEQLLALDDALCHLEKIDQLAANVFKLRFFSGLSLEEAAEGMHISRSATYEHWTFARAWLRSQL